jgi:integrase
MTSKSKIIPGSQESVPGYPKKLIIFRIANSKYWWTRVYMNGAMNVASTGVIDERNNKRLALEFAKQFYNDVLLKQRANPKSKIKNAQFSVVAASMIEVEKTTAKKSLYINDKGKVEGFYIPHFGEKLITEIEYSDLVQVMEKLNQKKLAPATKKHYLSLLSKIFKYAVQEGILKAIPPFPKLSERLKTKEKRDYFTFDEYRKINKACLDLASRGEKVRGIPITEELMLLNKFMVNSFLRPTDIRVLKHKHVKKVSDKEGDKKSEWLVLSHPATKTTAREVQTMEEGVQIYADLLKFRKADHAQKLKEAKAIQDPVKQKKALEALEGSPYTDPEDYVFFPSYQNRQTMMEAWRKLFKKAVEESKLEKTTGKNLQLYSLRHTSIMFRLIYGDVDNLILAKNARTSQAVIEQHYGAHLTTAQARKRLHSFIKPKE